ncbi:MAG: TIGR03118 family protein [Nitrososphaerota archaeon]
MSGSQRRSTNQQMYYENPKFFSSTHSCTKLCCDRCNKKCGKKDCVRCVNICFQCPPKCFQPCNTSELCMKKSVVTWKINYLVSNTPNQAAHMDPDLKNPWGIVVFNTQLWVSNNSSDKLTNYDLFGNKLLGSVNIRDSEHNSSNPTGLAINCGGGFMISNDTITRPSRFLLSTEHGTVHGYNTNVEALDSFVVVNEQLKGNISTYKGIAVVNDTLYLANFSKRSIDVFDSNYVLQTNYPFVDGDTSEPIPQDFSPYNIVNIGRFLYVLWARKDPKHLLHDISGPGLGYISVFNLDGSFVKRFASKGVLNSPWAMIPAPCECGIPPDSFLVGNHGDGRINIFDCNGRFVGPLLNQNGLPIAIDGLHGLAPYYTSCSRGERFFSEIFFTSSISDEYDGLLGSLVVDSIVDI